MGRNVLADLCKVDRREVSTSTWHGTRVGHPFAPRNRNGGSLAPHGASENRTGRVGFRAGVVESCDDEGSIFTTHGTRPPP